jgi:hypothetical protein
MNWLPAWLLNMSANLVAGLVLAVIIAFVGWLRRGQNPRLWRIVISTVIAIIVGLFGLWIGDSIGRQNAEAELRPLLTTLQARPVAVDSMKDWQSTGINVKKGDRITVRVVGGKWTGFRRRLPDSAMNALPDEVKGSNPQEIWMNMWPENSGEGIDQICVYDPKDPCPVSNFKVTGLVARIGSGEPFGIGNATTFQAPNDGMIYLRINDGSSQGTINLEDNAGILSVEINLER